METERPVRNFAGWRPVWEQVQARLTPTDWPAALAGRLGAPEEVVLRRERVLRPGSLGTAPTLPPFEEVTVCGVDDHMAGYPDAEQAFAGATPIRLLLMHAPSGLLDIGERPFTIGFAGHTHGGQIALPNGYPVFVPYGPLSRRYCSGRFELPRHRVLLVSRGVGCSTVPIRWNVSPEVHLCSLRLDER